MLRRIHPVLLVMMLLLLVVGLLAGYNIVYRNSVLRTEAGAAKNTSNTSSIYSVVTSDLTTSNTANPVHFVYNPRSDILWTFDDCEKGIGQGVVADYIKILKEHHINRAVFFTTGQCYHARPDIIQEIRNSGYEIGNHTFSHRDLTKLTSAEIDYEIRNGPAGARYFRPPYGAVNDLVSQRIKAAGLIQLLWGASGGDSGTEGMNRTCDRILEDLIHTTDPGDAVLLHMYNPHSPPAMEAYLSGKPSCED